MYLLLISLVAKLALADNDLAAKQILTYMQEHPVPVGELTTSNGAPVYYNEAKSTLNKTLFNHRYFMETITHFVRERTPERLVHAKGAGAFGYFEVTNDISDICNADFLNKVGKKTPVALRFSLTTGEKGFNDMSRGTKGFALKFYTKQGNLDFVGFNTEMYVYKDPIKFSTLVHSARRNPSTNLPDLKMFWDMITLNPETIHMIMLIYSDRGMPASYRYMPGFPIHLYQVEGKNGTTSYIKFHFMPKDGIKNFTAKEAAVVGASDPDFYVRDLYNAIAEGNFPSWIVYVQILSDEDLDKIGRARAFDSTRIISTEDYPLREIGTLVLNRNPKNFFAEMEQLALCPCNLVPGILGSPEQLFQGRVLAYRDAQLYRLGVNNNKIPANCPYRVQTHTYYRDGVPPVNDNEQDVPNYYPNSFNGPVPSNEARTRLINITESDAPDNFDQASELYVNLSQDEQTRVVENFVADLLQISEELQERAIQLFSAVNNELGDRVRLSLQEAKSIA